MMYIMCIFRHCVFCCMFEEGCLIFTVKVSCALVVGGCIYYVRCCVVFSLVQCHFEWVLFSWCSSLGIGSRFCLTLVVMCAESGALHAAFFVVVCSGLIGGGTVLSSQRAILGYHMCWCQGSCEPALAHCF